MKKTFLLVLIFTLGFAVFPIQSAQADGGVMVYFIPVEQIGKNRGPMYFAWHAPGTVGTGTITCTWNMMDYGLINVALLATPDITPADDAFLRAQAGVYAFPDNLDQAISDKAALTAILEPAKIPTDWVTASTTYRQLLRQMAGLIQFNQRFRGISGGASIFDNGVTLDSNYNSLDAQHKTWFVATLQSFGFGSGVQGNPKLRSLAKQAGDLWGAAPFFLGNYTF